ncbi:fimbrial protein [Salmonella enterica subsp. enterica serovar Adjame]|nr:fimbrial protein [Salmonella enterica subsp. enterica serovar Hillingdon str. N1529-D3]EFT1971931.1 fimbrial protein [Salmonella enterica]EFT2175869.1 fimbrial protein [Salmonella enterica subsp. enterica serovar Kingston]EFT2213553.1 fimbrial protein [Salmonella enterica subsp. enterica serovar Adjame]EFT6906152.1 fimbrial protein [Salmonella enterica subsp. enterica]
MKRNRFTLPIAAFVAMAASGSALAANSTNLDVNFTATIKETTCDMKLVGGTGSDTIQELIIGNSSGEVRIDDVRAGTATADFKLVIVECPASLQSLKTSINGTPSGYSTKILTNGTKGSADYTGVSVARSSKPDEPFVINSTVDSERLVWSEAEINSKEVPLIAIMKETNANSATTGAFSAVATFVFTYE